MIGEESLSVELSKSSLGAGSAHESGGDVVGAAVWLSGAAVWVQEHCGVFRGGCRVLLWGGCRCGCIRGRLRVNRCRCSILYLWIWIRRSRLLLVEGGDGDSGVVVVCVSDVRGAVVGEVEVEGGDVVVDVGVVVGVRVVLSMRVRSLVVVVCIRLLLVVCVLGFCIGVVVFLLNTSGL